VRSRVARWAALRVCGEPSPCPSSAAPTTRQRIATPPAEAGAARRLAIAGALLELAAAKAMEMRLGQLLGEPYRQGAAGRYIRLAKGCNAAAAALVALEGRRRVGSAIGADCSLPGLCSSAWPSTESALSRPPTRSTPLCHNASAPRASAAKRRRVCPGAELPPRRHSAETAKGSTGSLGASRRRLAAHAAHLRSPSR
jgi:hypothetical protein